jgi:hypothetical protein
MSPKKMRKDAGPTCDTRSEPRVRVAGGTSNLRAPLLESYFAVDTQWNCFRDMCTVRLSLYSNAFRTRPACKPQLFGQAQQAMENL